MSEPSAESPLAEVVRDRRINSILEQIRQAIRQHQPIVIEPKDIDYIQRSFLKGLSLGELKLYELAKIFLDRFALNHKIQVTLVVWGRCSSPGHDEVLTSEVDLTDNPEKLNTNSDTRMGDSFPPLCPQCGIKSNVIASYVRHDPKQNEGSILVSVQTRIKTTANICYKIADLVFDIDFMFQRDKIYNEFSQIVSDIYGLKIIVSEEKDIAAVINHCKEIPGTVVVNEKDYLGKNKKKSGYEAYKLVIKRERQLIEIQIQSKAMYTFEQTSRSASHKTYKERQMLDRKKLGREYIELYQALSQLFSTPEMNYCSIDYIEIGQTTKGLDDEF